MKRLTNYDRWHDDIDLKNELGYKYIYDRLAEYENTGMTPDEIKAMQWTSVEDRLPDYKDGKVLIYTVYGISIAKRTINNRWEGHCAIPKFITHWMPLPEPPKGELK